jgi:cardiolipin synthase
LDGTLVSWRTLLPNALTLLRLVATPLIVWAILEGSYGLALGVFFLAGISDGLDGVLARRLGGVSRFGAYLDPIADKVFVVAVYLALAARALAPWWLVGLALGRDLLILVGAALLLALGKKRDFRPSIWGKAATTIHVVTIVTLLVWRAAAWAWVGPIAAGMILLAGAATVASGCHYAWQAWRDPVLES